MRHELLPLCSEIAGRDLVPVLARQAGLMAGEADLLDVLAAAVDPSDCAVLAGAPVPLARRAARRWLRHGGPHPPDLAAVERVLGVARGEATATDVAPGVRVRRSHGRLSVVPVAGADRARRPSRSNVDLALVVSAANGRKGGVALAGPGTTGVGCDRPLGRRS